MKWNMELDEIEATLEKIWDLHDKLSDAIHSISRTHFLNSIKTPKKSPKQKLFNDVVEDNRAGFVFVKDFRVEDSDSAIQEAKSLNAIRSALENLEDQLEYFHTVQAHQRVERDAAIARLEQSRIVLAMRLTEHHGKNYKVIEEALAFVGDGQDSSQFVSPENLYGSPSSPSGKNFVAREGKRPNLLIRFLISSLNFAKTSLKLDNVGGILGNAAMVAVSMIAFLHMHQLAYKKHPLKHGDNIYSSKSVRRISGREGSSSNGHPNHLDVMSARG
ncbi:hypothetical protein CFOL_v3_09746 [Cephalotus follicularis]|uniref:Plastid division protein PDV1 n=1 Tax=Cephalotus follicularis TaxID=3775 RepID=A0A1Q3BDY2_CEPFO|nr:hypothetical protein CFOL_v3_09746 [Cephalotus follicularis]